MTGVQTCALPILTFYEDVKGSVLKVFNTWQQRIRSTSSGTSFGNYYPAAYYQAQFIIGLMDNNDNITYRATMDGVWPTAITNLSMTGADINRLALSVTFSVNNVSWS